MAVFAGVQRCSSSLPLMQFVVYCALCGIWNVVTLYAAVLGSSSMGQPIGSIGPLRRCHQAGPHSADSRTAPPVPSGADSGSDFPSVRIHTPQHRFRLRQRFRLTPLIIAAGRSAPASVPGRTHLASPHARIEPGASAAPTAPPLHALWRGAFSLPRAALPPQRSVPPTARVASVHPACSHGAPNFPRRSMPAVLRRSMPVLLTGSTDSHDDDPRGSRNASTARSTPPSPAQPLPSPPRAIGAQSLRPPGRLQRYPYYYI